MRSVVICGTHSHIHDCTDIFNTCSLRNKMTNCDRTSSSQLFPSFRRLYFPESPAFHTLMVMLAFDRIWIGQQTLAFTAACIWLSCHNWKNCVVCVHGTSIERVNGKTNKKRARGRERKIFYKCKQIRLSDFFGRGLAWHSFEFRIWEFHCLYDEQ